jgi:xanthine dehydrogenase accessory factor
MCKVIAYVGAGGKTSSILEEALRLHEKGKRVVVTTTTRMKLPQRWPEGTDHLTESLDEVEMLLGQGEIVWYGHPAERRKFGGPFPDNLQEWEMLCRLADVILVEADGSKRLPVKVPAAHEPVIPGNTEQIVIVMGMSGLNRPVGEVCHRLPLVLALLEKKEEDILTQSDYAILLLEGYIKPLHRTFPSCKLTVYLNQVTNTALLDAAKQIRIEVEHKSHIPMEWQYVNYIRAVTSVPYH